MSSPVIGWFLVRESQGCIKTDPGRAAARGAPPDRVTEALISQWKAHSAEPVFCTRVDPVQEEVFLGSVPTLTVTSQWRRRKPGSPEPRSLTGKHCQRFLHEQAHWVGSFIPNPQGLFTGWNEASGLGCGGSPAWSQGLWWCHKIALLCAFPGGTSIWLPCKQALCNPPLRCHVQNSDWPEKRNFPLEKCNVWRLGYILPLAWCFLVAVERKGRSPPSSAPWMECASWQRRWVARRCYPVKIYSIFSCDLQTNDELTFQGSLHNIPSAREKSRGLGVQTSVRQLQGLPYPLLTK